MESPTSMTVPLVRAIRAVGAASSALATAPFGGGFLDLTFRIGPSARSWGDVLDLSLRFGRSPPAPTTTPSERDFRDLTLCLVPSPSVDLPDSTDGRSRHDSTDRMVGSAELVRAPEVKLGLGPPLAIRGGQSERNRSSVFSSGVVKVLPCNAEGDGRTVYRCPGHKRKRWETFLNMRLGGLVNVLLWDADGLGWTAYCRPRRKSRRRRTFGFNFKLPVAKESRYARRLGGLVNVLPWDADFGWTAYCRPRSKSRRRRTFGSNFKLPGAKESRYGRSLALPSRCLDSVVDPSLQLPGFRRSARLAALPGLPLPGIRRSARLAALPMKARLEAKLAAARGDI